MSKEGDDQYRYRKQREQELDKWFVSLKIEPLSIEKRAIDSLKSIKEMIDLLIEMLQKNIAQTMSSIIERKEL